MIPRITKGRSGYGALRYDYGRGRREEHDNPREVAGSVPGRWRGKAAMIDGHAAYRTDVQRPVWRSSLRAAPEDRALSDEAWGRIAESYVQRMGYERCPWTATRHGADHVHVTVSRLDWDGRLVHDRQDFARAQVVCREIEREHGLVDASERYDRGRPQVSHGERESADRRGIAPERIQLRGHLDAAERVSGGTREGYERALAERGVRAEVNVATTGRVSGYRYALDGHRDGSGQPVWFKGSQVGRDYSWAQTQTRLDRVRGSSRGPETARDRAASAVARIRGDRGERACVESAWDRAAPAVARIRGDRGERAGVESARERGAAGETPATSASRPGRPSGEQTTERGDQSMNQESGQPGANDSRGRDVDERERSDTPQSRAARVVAENRARQDRENDRDRDEGHGR